MKRRLLVTGASGFIGYPTLIAALAEGWEAMGIDLSLPEGGIPNVTVLQGDFTDTHQLYRVLSENHIDTIVHAGGVSGSMLFRDEPYRVCKANVIGTINLLEAARVIGVRRFVFLSSAQAYGDTPPPPVTEDAPFRPRNMYGATKAAGDLLVGAYREQHGMDAVALRISNGYGPRRYTTNAIRTMIEDAIAGRPTRLNVENDGYAYLYVNDAVSAIIAAVKAPQLRRGAYNIAGNQFESMKRISEIVQDILPNARITLTSSVNPSAPRRGLLDISCALRDFGWSPQWALEQGVAHYADWLHSCNGGPNSLRRVATT